MSPSLRQQRQALRRQRRQQRQSQRQLQRSARRRGRSHVASPHLSRRVRSGDLHSLDERQRRMAEAILGRRQRLAQSLEQAEPSPEAASPPE